MIRRRRLRKDPKTGKYSLIPIAVRWYWDEHLASFYKDNIFHFYRKFVDEDTELRKKLLEKTFIDLVKKRYAEDYLKTKPESPSAKDFQDFIKKDYVTDSRAIATFKKQGFQVIEVLSEYYTIAFEYKDGQLIYDDVHADEVFDEIWGDIDLIMEFVSKHIGSISKERAKLFRKYLLEDADSYLSGNELKKQIKTIFLPLEAAELVQHIREDIVEEMKVSQKAIEAGNALEVFTGERFSAVASGIVPYEDTRQTWRQPFAEQYGVRLWTTLYEKAPLPSKSVERIRIFLMSNFYDLFLYLIPHEISSSKKLEQDIAAGNKLATEFKYVMTDFFSSVSKDGFFITKGGYGKAAYFVTKNNLSMLYADELGLKEAYAKYSSAYPEIKALFKKMYRWTKDLDEKIELEEALQKRKEKALKQYFYSYEEEQAQEDMPARKLLNKIPPNVDIGVDVDTAMLTELKELEKIKKEGFSWNQQQSVM